MGIMRLILQYMIMQSGVKKIKITKMANISQNWLDVLIPFSHEYDKKITGSEIAKIMNIPQRTAARHLNELVKANLLRFEVRGKNKFYYFDLRSERSKIILGLVESYKSFLFSLNTDLWIYLRELSGFGTLVLFGSHTKDYASKLSDIDLVIFAKKTKKINELMEKLPKVQAHFVSIEKFEKILKSGKVLAREIIRNHVVFGDISGFTDVCWRFYKK